MAVSNDELRDLFIQFFKFLENLTFVFGQIGIIEDGRDVIYVPNKSRQYVLVRVYRTTGVTVAEAINTKVSPEFDLWVKMKENDDGILEIIDAADLQALASTAGNAPNLSVSPHSHKLGLTGLEDLVEGRRLEPGGVYFDEDRGGLWIKVFPLHHSGGYFTGGSIEMTPYMPALTNNKNWTKIGLDRSTNLLEIIKGPDVPVSSLMSESTVQAMTFVGSDVLPLAAIVLRGEEIQFSRNTRVADLRYWGGGPAAGASFTGLEHFELANEFTILVTGIGEVNFEDFLFEFDTNSFDNESDTDRAVINTAGRYFVSVHYSLEDNSGGSGWSNVEVEVTKNVANTPLFAHEGAQDSSGTPNIMNFTFQKIVQLEVDDYLRVRAQRTDGVDDVNVDLFSFSGILIAPS